MTSVDDDSSTKQQPISYPSLLDNDKHCVVNRKTTPVDIAVPKLFMSSSSSSSNIFRVGMPLKFEVGENRVERSYNDFELLRDQLVFESHGAIVPRLPSRSLTDVEAGFIENNSSSSSSSSKTIDQLSNDISLWLHEVLMCPHLSSSSVALNQFLTTHTNARLLQRSTTSSHQQQADLKTSLFDMCRVFFWRLKQRMYSGGGGNAAFLSLPGSLTPDDEAVVRWHQSLAERHVRNATSLLNVTSSETRHRSALVDLQRRSEVELRTVSELASAANNEGVLPLLQSVQTFSKQNSQTIVDDERLSNNTMKAARSLNQLLLLTRGYADSAYALLHQRDLCHALGEQLLSLPVAASNNTADAKRLELQQRFDDSVALCRTMIKNLDSSFRYYDERRCALLLTAIHSQIQPATTQTSTTMMMTSGSTTSTNTTK